MSLFTYFHFKCRITQIDKISDLAQSISLDDSVPRFDVLVMLTPLATDTLRLVIKFDIP
jgi:hypothetical protein